MRPVIIVSGLYSVIIASQIIHHIYFGVWIAPTDVSLLFSEIDEILLSLTTIWKEIIATLLVVLAAFVAVMRLGGKFENITCSMFGFSFRHSLRVRKMLTFWVWFWDAFAKNWATKTMRNSTHKKHVPKV